MVLVYETPEEFFAPIPTQEQAVELQQVTNQVIYALVQKANKYKNFNIDKYLVFSEKKEWLEDYSQTFDADLDIEVSEINDFAKIADAIAKGEAYNPYESQRGE